jgi:nucleotide-binding universal stress UspA family protein
MRVVVGYDGSEAAKRALDRAASLADRAVPVTVVSVVRPLGGPARGIKPYNPTEIEERRAALGDARERLAKLGLPAATVEGRGDPEDVIAEVAERENADMILVGTRGHGALGRVLHGSVSSKLLRRANRDVMVVR